MVDFSAIRMLMSIQDPAKCNRHDDSGCNNGLTNNGFASRQEEYHVHGDQLKLHRSRHLQKIRVTP